MKRRSRLSANSEYRGPPTRILRIITDLTNLNTICHPHRKTESHPQLVDANPPTLVVKALGVGNDFAHLD